MSRVVAECSFLKQCLICEVGSTGLIRVQISLSRSLLNVHRREIGLYDVERVGGLLIFRLGIMCACFHIVGMVL